MGKLCFLVEMACCLLIDCFSSLQNDEAGGATKRETEKQCSSCREAFTGSLRRMYGLPANWTNLPPMPADGGTWSALHSWAMPTSSFVELVLFAR